MAFCFVHPTVASTGTCDDCKRAICTRCTKGTLDGFMCPPCAHKRYRHRRVVTGLKVGAVAAVMVGLAVGGLMIVGQGSERPAAVAAAVATEKDPLIAALREQRDLAPCDKVMVRKLVGELSKAGRYAEVVDDGNRFFAKCGPLPRLEWQVVYALQQLGRYSEAVKHETVLIEDNPFDSDFWWWRAEDRARSGQAVEALADLRQSFANSEQASSARFAAARVLDVAGPGGQPCEAVLALDYFVEGLLGELDDDRERRVRGLDLSAHCSELRGTGTTVIPPSDSADGAIRVPVVVGGVPGVFVLDRACGTTILATGFAQRAQVAPRAGATVQTVAFGQVRAGQPATVSIAVGPAVGPGVEVVIVDALPPDVDGVLGLSFVWKFEQTMVEGGLELAPGRAP